MTCSLTIKSLPLSRLIVKHLDTLSNLTSEFDKLPMGWILCYIVVSVFCILKLDHEAVGRVTLYLYQLRWNRVQDEVLTA